MADALKRLARADRKIVNGEARQKRRADARTGGAAVSAKAERHITPHPPWQMGLMGDVRKSTSTSSFFIQGSWSFLQGGCYPLRAMASFPSGKTDESIRRIAASQRQLEIQRWMLEYLAQHLYTFGVHEDDPPEAMHRMVVDLLDEGHTPSREMLLMLSGELKEMWWPVGSPNKQRQHSKELAFVYGVQQEINYCAAKKYRNARGARTKAEQDVAEMRGLSVAALRKRLERFRARLKKRKPHRRATQAPAEKVGHFFEKASVDRALVWAAIFPVSQGNHSETHPCPVSLPTGYLTTPRLPRLLAGSFDDLRAPVSWIAGRHCATGKKTSVSDSRWDGSRTQHEALEQAARDDTVAAFPSSRTRCLRSRAARRASHYASEGDRVTRWIVRAIRLPSAATTPT